MFFLCVGTCTPFLCDLDVAVYFICFYAYNNKFETFRRFSLVKVLKLDIKMLILNLRRACADTEYIGYTQK